MQLEVNEARFVFILELLSSPPSRFLAVNNPSIATKTNFFNDSSAFCSDSACESLLLHFQYWHNRAFLAFVWRTFTPLRPYSLRR